MTRHLAYLGQFIPRPENLEHPLIGACSLNAWTSWNRRLFCNLSRKRRLLGRVGGIRIWGSFFGAPKQGLGGVKPGFGAPKKEVPLGRSNQDLGFFWSPKAGFGGGQTRVWGTKKRCPKAGLGLFFGSPKAGFGRFRRW